MTKTDTYCEDLYKQQLIIKYPNLYTSQQYDSSILQSADIFLL